MSLPSLEDLKRRLNERKVANTENARTGVETFQDVLIDIVWSIVYGFESENLRQLQTLQTEIGAVARQLATQSRETQEGFVGLGVQIGEIQAKLGRTMDEHAERIERLEARENASSQP